MRKGLALFLTGCLVLASGSRLVAEDGKAGDKSLTALVTGNRRYVRSHLRHPHQSPAWRHKIAKAQHPIAAILSCADSRVPPELVFDEGLGDIFTVRVAGNVVDDAITGSLEYAAEHLHVPLIVVLGHSSCGAVKAAIAGGEPNTHIDSLVKAIEPAIEKAKHEEGDLLKNAVRDNVLQSVEALKSAKPLLEEMVKAGKVRIVGAIYDLDSGRVTFLKP